MRTFLTVLAVAALLAVGGSDSAVVADGGQQGTIGVHLQAPGSQGVLQIVGAPGMPFDAFTPAGVPVAGGVLASPNQTQGVSGLAGPGSQLTVIVGGSVLSVAHEEWDWN